MSAFLGDFRTGKVVRKMWNSNAIAGESITRATNGTVSVYKDGGTTQSTTGVTDTEDFDGLTGVHLVAVDTSADGTFYSAGSDFEVVLSAATIDGKTINATLFSFSLENRSALMPTTDGRKLDVSAGGEAGVDWANVGSPTTTVGLSGTTVKTATDVETDTADIQTRLPAALVGGRIDANTGAISGDSVAADTLELFAEALDQVTGQLDNGSLADDTISSGKIAASALTSGKFASGAIHATAIAADAIRPDTIATDAITAAKIAADAIAEIADGVWDEAIAGHAGAGSTGAALSAAGSAGDPWSTALPGAYGAGTAGKIVGDNLNATVSSRASQASVDTVDGIVDAILVDTAEIGTAGAGLTALATAAALDTVDNFLDTEIAAIKAKTDNLPAAPAATGDIPTATQNADALLNRDMGAVTVTNSRSPINALRVLRNKWSIAAGIYTVREEDDTTTAWTSSLSTDAAAEPVTGSDPA